MHSSAKKLQRILPSSEIRKTFIDYFTCSHDHKFVRSSPVVPFCDPTVAFVNAGMNQFKSIFLGKTQPPYPRVTNSQKCVRVGGKHNDLTVVGQDGYHHTFFEMLGNWSFGDYFKRNACEYALELLRGPYNIDPRRLYVTYFAGDKVLGLPADLECLEIWRSLGFPSERILPFGSKDNFWEMGTTGPCGPCTEIHIDHLPHDGGAARTAERAKLVNAGSAGLTELWNLVFIQYNRNEDGSISKLPAMHVDTGMGFERLTAILQHKTSNYDTDLFTPFFRTIQQVTKAPAYEGRFPTALDQAALDTGYRVLADHARMITACLADGMLPDQNQKLRRVLRKAFNVSESVFADERLLAQLVPVVVDTLGSAYPEMAAKQHSVLELIAHELEIYKLLRESSAKAFSEIISDYPNLVDVEELMESPGFVPAYREFRAQREHFANNIIPGRFLFKLTDTYGLTEDNFQRLAELEGMECDLAGYREVLAGAKLRSKTTTNDEGGSSLKLEQLLTDLTRTLPPTDDRHKYEYEYDTTTSTYHIPPVRTAISGLILHDSAVERVTGAEWQPSKLLYVITEASNFYCESGGQEADRGRLRLVAPTSGLELEVVGVEALNGCVVHACRLPAADSAATNFQLSKGATVELIVDAEHRQLNTCHHTATHLLNAAIRQLFNKVTYQVSSSVTREASKLELGLIGQRIGKDDVARVEDIIGRVICSASPVQVDLIDASAVLQQNDITMVPGEIYPETGLRLITVHGGGDLGVLSKELCCGTHVNNTRELGYFSITHVKQTNRARYAFTAVAGKAAENVLKAAALIRHRVDGLEQQYKTDKLTNATESELQQIRHQILHGSITLPYAFKTDTLERINEILRKLKDTARLSLKEFVEVEMKNLLLEHPIATHPFILHYISSSALMEEVPLQRATKVCTDRPILVVGMCDGVVKARCCVPPAFVSASFDAEKWLNEFAVVFKAQVAPPRNQNASQVCNMKGRKVTTQFEEQLEVAMARADAFAAKHLL